MIIAMIQNKNHIAELWQQLEKEKTIGLVKRLYSSKINYNVYSTFQYPECYYGIAFNYSNNINIDISNFNNLRDLKVLLLDDTSFESKKILIIELLQPTNKDIFSILCENLIQSIIKSDSEQIFIRNAVNQLIKWQTLFDKISYNGLSVEQQQGLYGELVFLHKFLLQQDSNHLEVLNSWVGTEGYLRDFQHSTWAIEVKTTITNNPQKITINGERQLDETLLENLFLFHCSMEISNGNGETLNQKISNIRSLLKSDISILNLFNSKLLEVGYFDNHAYKYENIFYKIRTETYYNIKDDFPRIKENELRNGVSGVKYNITISMCDKYKITDNQLFNIIANL